MHTYIIYCYIIHMCTYINMHACMHTVLPSHTSYVYTIIYMHILHTTKLLKK